MTNLERAREHMNRRLADPARRYCGAGVMLEPDIQALAVLLDEAERRGERMAEARAPSPLLVDE